MSVPQELLELVETKLLSVNIKADISPAFQLRRYAWSAKLPLSILTDFEEFAVYNFGYSQTSSGNIQLLKF